MSTDTTATPIETQNVVVSTSIDQELDLETLSPNLERASYDPDTFPAIQYQLEEPAVTVMLYRSGAIIGTGADSITQARAGVQQTYDDLNELGISITPETAVDVQNIVSTANLDQRLNLTAVAIGLGLEHVEYEPEQFPGLIYRLPDTRAVILLFGSGQAVITRCKTAGQAHEALQKLTDRLSNLDIIDKRANNEPT